MTGPKPDVLYASKTEKYELRHFIEHFLDTTGKAHTAANRQAVLSAINAYAGAEPILRMALKTHVQKTVRWP